MKPVFISYCSHHRSTLLGGGLMLIALIMIASAFVAPEHTLAQTGATPTPLPLYALPDARTNRAYVSSSIALATDGRTLVAANLINNTATISVPTFSEVVAEIPVGRDPRSAAITADDAHALITNRADGTLSVINMAETIVTATISLGAGTLPYAVVTVLAALQGFDRTQLRAATSLGAPFHLVLRRVVLPQIAPAVASGALFAFATSFDELIVALFIAGPEQFTLPRQMLAGLREFLSPTICAAAVVVTAISLLLLALHEILARHWRKR